MFEAAQEQEERDGEDGEYGRYLDRFFEEHEYPSVAWLQDLGRGRYAMAAQSLLVEAERAAELESKHVRRRVFHYWGDRVLISGDSAYVEHRQAVVSRTSPGYGVCHG